MLHTTRIILHNLHISSLWGSPLQKPPVHPNVSHPPTTTRHPNQPNLLNDIHHITVHVMTVEAIDSHLSHETTMSRRSSFFFKRGVETICIRGTVFGWDLFMNMPVIYVPSFLHTDFYISCENTFSQS